MNLKKIDKKLYMYLGIGMAIMVVLLIIIILISVFVGGRVSYNAAESKMVSAAKSYFANNTDQLPTSGNTTTVTMEQLVEAKLIKSFDKLLTNKEAVCSGYVNVSNNNEHYLYLPYMDCGDDYKTTKLYTKILENNPITDNSDGLYKINNDYIFRGEFVNNYVSFANKLWRIVKITEDGTIRMIETKRIGSFIWDDRYNIDYSSNTGINDYRVSRAKDSVEEIYNNDEEFTEEERSIIVPQNLCIGKQPEDGTDKSGAVECSDILENQYISLLQANEYIIASIDQNCSKLSDEQCANYNYMSTFDRSFWTLTGNSEKSNKVFKIAISPIVTYASSNAAIQVVIHISNNVIYGSGDGTESNPYTIQGMKTS